MSAVLGFYLSRGGRRGTPIPQPPTAVGDSRNILAGEMTVAVDVLANDSNVADAVVTIQGPVVGADAAVDDDDQTILVTRIGQAAGSYSLTYRATTAAGSSDAILSGTIAALPPAPVAVPDVRNLAATEIAVSVPVLANDSNVAGAVVTIQGAVTGATAAVAADGATITVTRIGTGAGSYSLTYRATTVGGFGAASLSGSIAAYQAVGVPEFAGTTASPGAEIDARAGTTAAPGAVIPTQAGTS